MVKELITDPSVLIKSKLWKVLEDHNRMVEIVQDCDDTLKSRDDLIYVCSNEVGHEERAIDIKFSDDTVIMMNPSFQKRDKMTLIREKDRLNGKEYLVPRYLEIEIVYQDCLGTVKANKVTDQAAIVICQAMDTLNGLFAQDYGLEIIPEFDLATEEDRQNIINEYLNSLSKAYNQLDKQLSENDETKDYWRSAKFIKKVSDGEIELEKEELSNRKKKKIESLTKKLKEQKNRLKFWSKK